jgi:hypothetical protein
MQVHFLNVADLSRLEVSFPPGFESGIVLEVY